MSLDTLMLGVEKLAKPCLLLISCTCQNHSICLFFFSVLARTATRSRQDRSKRYTLPFSGPTWTPSPSTPSLIFILCSESWQVVINERCRHFFVARYRNDSHSIDRLWWQYQAFCHCCYSFACAETELEAHGGSSHLKRWNTLVYQALYGVFTFLCSVISIASS